MTRRKCSAKPGVADPVPSNLFSFFYLRMYLSLEVVSKVVKYLEMTMDGLVNFDDNMKDEVTNEDECSVEQGKNRVIKNH